MKTMLAFVLISIAIGLGWIAICYRPRKPINLEPTAGDPRE